MSHLFIYRQPTFQQTLSYHSSKSVIYWKPSYILFNVIKNCVYINKWVSITRTKAEGQMLFIPEDFRFVKYAEIV